MDIAYTNDESELEIKINFGNGNFSIQTVPIENTGNFILGEDFNRDGDLDIMVTGDNSNDIQMIWNNNGSFGNYSKVIDTDAIYSLHVADF